MWVLACETFRRQLDVKYGVMQLRNSCSRVATRPVNKRISEIFLAQIRHSRPFNARPIFWSSFWKFRSGFINSLINEADCYQRNRNRKRRPRVATDVLRRRKARGWQWLGQRHRLQAIEMIHHSKVLHTFDRRVPSGLINKRDGLHPDAAFHRPCKRPGYALANRNGDDSVPYDARFKGVNTRLQGTACPLKSIESPQLHPLVRRSNTRPAGAWGRKK